jgi:hypothetical protein
MTKVSGSSRTPPLSSAILEHIAADWDGFARAVLSDCAGPLGGCGCGSDPEGLESIWLSRRRLQASIIAGPGANNDVASSSARHLFLAAVAQGMAVADALAAFAQVSSGHFSHDDKCFFPENAVLGPVADRIRLLNGAERRVVCGSESESDVTLFFVDGAIAALVGGNRLRSRWLDDVRRDAGGLESLPDFITLPRDEEGRPIIPTSRVTALVDAREAWAT